MRRLTFALQFIRPASDGPQARQAAARSVRITTTITAEGVGAELQPLDEYQTAMLENTASVNPDGVSFSEWGTITFGEGGTNRLHFSSVGNGYINVYDCPEKPYTAGMVMWKIYKGEGFFEGATGAITSNFLIDLTKPGDTGELIDHHFYVVYLP